MGKRNQLEIKIRERVSEELGDFDRGNIDTMTSAEDLATSFDCSPELIRYHLRKHPEIHEKRSRFFRHKPKLGKRKIIIIPESSRDYSYFLRVLAGDGHSNYGETSNGGSIRLGVMIKDFRDKFARIGEELFGLEACLTESDHSRYNGNGIVYHARFGSTNLVEYLGDFRTFIWADTMREKYKWLSGDENYIWGFLEGMFDSEGSVSDGIRRKEQRQSHKISYSISSIKGVKFVENLLYQLGIEVNESKNKGYPEGITGIHFGDVGDIKKFAENVHSSIPEKERRLNLYRNALVTDSPPEKIVQAYNMAFKLRASRDFGPRRIRDSLTKMGYNVPISTINGWLYNGNCPMLNGNGRYNSIVFN